MKKTEEWLECRIAPGQFPSEFAVTGTLFNGKVFSLFAPVESVSYADEPTFEKSVEAFLRVLPLETRDDLVLVALPRETFENGQIITVRTSQFRSSPS